MAGADTPPLPTAGCIGIRGGHRLGGAYGDRRHGPGGKCAGRVLEHLAGGWCCSEWARFLAIALHKPLDALRQLRCWGLVPGNTRLVNASFALVPAGPLVFWLGTRREPSSRGISWWGSPSTVCLAVHYGPGRPDAGTAIPQPRYSETSAAPAVGRGHGVWKMHFGAVAVFHPRATNHTSRGTSTAATPRRA